MDPRHYRHATHTSPGLTGCHTTRCCWRSSGRLSQSGLLDTCRTLIDMSRSFRRPESGIFYGNGPGQHGYACSDVPQDPPGQDSPVPFTGQVRGRRRTKHSTDYSAKPGSSAGDSGHDPGSAHLRARSPGRCRVASVTLWQGRRVVMGLRARGCPKEVPSR
jgi:hypothetical protein